MNTTSENSTQPAERRRNNSNHKTRHWIPYLVGALILAAIVAGMWPKPIPVEVAEAVSGPLRASIVEEGKTRVRDRFLVSAPVSGLLERIPFKAGDAVEAGKTVVAVVRPVQPALLDARTRSQAQAKRDAAAARLERARAALQLAESEWNRIQRLYGEGVVSIQDQDNARWRQEAAAKEQKAAESDLRLADADLQSYSGNPGGNPSQPVRIEAPATGKVLRILEESSRVVTAGTPLMEIGDPNNLEVVIEVLSRDGAMISPGAPVELEQWGGNVLRGRIRLVEPAAFTKVSALGVEEQRVNAIADFVDPPEQRSSLGDSYRVEARVVLWESRQTLKVPTSALFRRGNDWAVFVVADNRAHLVPVETGKSGASETQILKGLSPGDRVILYPGDRIRDGQRVAEIQI